ncbi:cadherin-99C-like isoform X2 [Artemia franciscana]|uniref:Cadherin domain-containing protein n=1 Tax=Artemia franciscana TaxID=6661 RepID=A0AA88L715_ARTSF|nr:hypothetical protein QYM36_004636 [Artemia franciscana]
MVGKQRLLFFSVCWIQSFLSRCQAQDLRRPPIFSQLFYDGSVSEAASIGTAVMALKAFDNGGGKITYSIVEAGRVPFRVDSNTGMVIVDGKLDREQKSRFSFSVRAVNGDGLTSTSNVDILIEDVNDKVPEFIEQPYVFKVKENERIGYIGRVKAIDGDQGRNGMITYSVVPNDLIRIDPVSGELSTTRSLDYEKEQEIILEVIATDNGLPPLFSTSLVTILVEDTNDILPVFNESLYEADVPENEANYPIVTVEAISDDPKNFPTYIIRQGPVEKFTIDPLTGTIRTKEGLDFEEHEQHVLIIGTRENEAISDAEATTKVLIYVQDRNDNAPVFVNIPRPIRLPSTVPVGHVVSTVEAKDADSYAPANIVRYEILGSSKQVFSIDEIRGVIQVAEDLNKRQETEYVIEVRAYDMGDPQMSSTASITVIVDRIGTVSPEAGMGFAETIHSASILEDAEANTLIRTLVITNKPPEVSQISCEVIEGNSEGLFYAKTNFEGNCELRLSRPGLDHEQKIAYTVIIRLSTSFGLVGRGKTTARIDVFVVDVNDNAPVFVFPLPEGKYTYGKYWGAILPNWRPGAQIMTLTARDEDSGKFGEINYYLGNNDGKTNLLDLDSKSGIISLKTSIGNITADSLPSRFNVYARDNPGSSMGFHETPITVYIGVLQNHQEIVMIIRGSRKERVEKDKERILEILQTRLGLAVRIAAIKEHEFLDDSGTVMKNSESTDIIFYCIDSDFDRILPRENPQIVNGLFSDTARTQISNYIATYLSLEMQDIRGPLDSTQTSGHSLSASIIGWNGLPLALVALCAVVILTGLFSSVYVCCNWSKYKKKRDHRPPPVYFVPTFTGVTTSSEFNPKPYEVMEMSVNSDDSDRSDDLQPGLVAHRQFISKRRSLYDLKRPPSVVSETVTTRTSSMPRHQANNYGRSIYNHSIEQRDNNYSIIESPIPTTNPLFLDPSVSEAPDGLYSQENISFTEIEKSDCLDYSEVKTVL